MTSRCDLGPLSRRLCAARRRQCVALGAVLVFLSIFILFSHSFDLPEFAIAPGWSDEDPFHLPPPPPPGPVPPPFRPPRPPTAGSPDFSGVWGKRKQEVRDAYLHALRGYKKHAFPHDELLATTGGSSDKFNGWGVSIVDSMDTMWMMGLHGEFYEAVGFVAGLNFTTKRLAFAPFFETTIRYLGGMLSAYALSNETILLTRADDLGMILLPAFNGTSSGFPAYSVDTQTGAVGDGWLGNVLIWAEATSCQLEFKYLAKLTGRSTYFEKVDSIMNKIYSAPVQNGLFPVLWSKDGKPHNQHFSVGASGDSGYEYLLKQWLLTGDEKARDQYLRSIEGILENLFYVTPNRQLVYVTDAHGPNPTHVQEHLSCFLPGVLALGVHTLGDALAPETRELHQWAAEGLAYTCYISYADQKTGLGPDVMRMTPGEKWVERVASWKDSGRPGGVPPGLAEGGRNDKEERDYVTTSPVYLLRPETIESMYMLWKTTGDVKWRERGYEIFKSIQKFSRTKYGYASVSQVDTDSGKKIDDMPSYFLAETLKYLFLLFDDSESYPLNKWVYNTEAHPLPVFTWNSWEREAYKIG